MRDPSSKQPVLLDVDQAAAYLNVSRRWLRRAIAESRFPVIKLGALVRIDEADLAAYIQANRRGPTTPSVRRTKA